MGIQLWSGLSNVQTGYKAYEIPVTSPEKAGKKEPDPEITSAALPSEEELPVTEKEVPAAEDKRSKQADLENISLTFHKEETFDYIGSESGLANLDMQKAISDMKKDSILQDYQYFVGSSKNIFSSEDGMVLPK